MAWMEDYSFSPAIFSKNAVPDWVSDCQVFEVEFALRE